MLKANKLSFIALIYIVIVTIGGKLLFTLPNKKYLDILNTDQFYLLSLILTLTFMLTIQFTKLNNKIKMKLTVFFTLVVFTIVGVYYYFNLPKYTYEQAVIKIEQQKSNALNYLQAHIPPHREDKIGKGTPSFFKTTTSLYYIYFKYEEDLVVYQFNPLDGSFKKHTGNRTLEE